MSNKTSLRKRSSIITTTPQKKETILVGTCGPHAHVPGMPVDIQTNAPLWVFIDQSDQGMLPSQMKIVAHGLGDMSNLAGVLDQLLTWVCAGLDLDPMRVPARQVRTSDLLSQFEFHQGCGEPHLFPSRGQRWVTVQVISNPDTDELSVMFDCGGDLDDHVQAVSVLRLAQMVAKRGLADPSRVQVSTIEG